MLEPAEKRKIAVMGLGYVGLPLAVAFGRQRDVVGFDIHAGRIDELRLGFDRTSEFTQKQIQESSIHFTTNVDELKGVNFFIISVPTPIDKAKRPDLQFVISASKIVAPLLKQGDVVVYESTVYPGATEEECVPILEQISGKKSGKDFFVGYSPERINPGDKTHGLGDVVKVVSAQTSEALEVVAGVYGAVVRAGVHRAPSIRVAEAAKVIENTQRDLNVALINELALIFHRMGIDTHEVLEAARTKWNFLAFTPGLVGGHCIGVDPYYLTYKAEQLDYHPEVILAGRRVNDNMGRYVAQQTVLQMIHQGHSIKGSKTAILGATFKENCPDVRNSRVFDMVSELRSFGVEVLVHDPLANPSEIKEEYGEELQEWDALPKTNAIILAVPHDRFRHLRALDFQSKLLPNGLVIDVKACLDREDFASTKVPLWRL